MRSPREITCKERTKDIGGSLKNTTFARPTDTDEIANRGGRARERNVIQVKRKTF